VPLLRKWPLTQPAWAAKLVMVMVAARTNLINDFMIFVFSFGGRFAGAGDIRRLIEVCAPETAFTYSIANGGGFLTTMLTMDDAQHEKRRLGRAGAIQWEPANLHALRGAGIFAAVSTISISELKKKPAGAWLKSAAKHDLVITSKGQPVAVLVRIAAGSADSTRALLRSVRALQAQAALQQAATANGTASLSMSDIDAEITAARRARRRK
jgi:prevent-host-death family protein